MKIETLTREYFFRLLGTDERNAVVVEIWKTLVHNRYTIVRVVMDNFITKEMKKTDI